MSAFLSLRLLMQSRLFDDVIIVFLLNLIEIRHSLIIQVLLNLYSLSRSELLHALLMLDQGRIKPSC